MNASDADGYVVYASIQYTSSHLSSAIDVGNRTQHTLVSKPPPLYGYNITVRAYQDLLGPASEPMLIPTIDCKFNAYYYTAAEL